MKNNNRRDFLKKLSALGAGLGIISATPMAADAATTAGAEKKVKSGGKKSKPVTVSILQTTDVHCQVHAHDELFWENNQAVFRKTGGYAHLAS